MDDQLTSAAQAGDGQAFARLVERHVPKLRAVVRRMVGHPEDTEDLVQQALLQAHQGIQGFRRGSSLGTWLCSIGVRLAIDHLRARKRYREGAQSIFAAACLESESLGRQVGAALSDPSFQFDVNEHIAYCFTCIGRTLEPEEQAALVLRDVLALSTEEAATALGISTSVLRHRLRDGRHSMQSTYAGLCALVSKQGACWQCSGLRSAAPEGRRGPIVPDSVDWAERIARVRAVALEGDASRALHDVFFRETESQEQERRGEDGTVTDCGRPDAGHRHAADAGGADRGGDGGDGGAENGS